MFAALIAVSLAYDPIPKTKYEGSIAVLALHQGQRIHIFNPSGKLEKTVELKDISEQAEAVKLSRDARSALLMTHRDSVIRIGGKAYRAYSIYLIDLNGLNKPKLLIENKATTKWVFGSNGSNAYGSLLDEGKQPKKPGQNNKEYSTSWTIDLKSGILKAIELPSEHHIVDITADGETLLTMTRLEKKLCAALIPVKTLKPELIPFDQSLLPRGIASDGRKILAVDYTDVVKGGTADPIIYDLKSKSKQLIAVPNGASYPSAYAFGVDGKRICYIANYKDPDTFRESHRLFTANMDGTNQKMIYEAKAGEVLSDCDWR